MFVDAIDDTAADFCRKYGFIKLAEHKGKLFLPMKTTAKMLGGRYAFMGTRTPVFPASVFAASYPSPDGAHPHAGSMMAVSCS